MKNQYSTNSQYSHSDITNMCCNDIAMSMADVVIGSIWISGTCRFDCGFVELMGFQE